MISLALICINEIIRTIIPCGDSCSVELLCVVYTFLLYHVLKNVCITECLNYRRDERGGSMGLLW